METSFTVILSSAVVAALVSLMGQAIAWLLSRDQKRYEVLYGPLRYHLLMMKIITKNQAEVVAEIRGDLRDPVDRIEAHKKHGSPLVKKWQEHKDSVFYLIKEFPGFIKKKDLPFIENFLDGYIKRGITEEGTNVMSTEERIDKIMNAIKELQDRLL